MCREFDEALEAGEVTGLAGDRRVGASVDDDADARRVPTGLARVQAFLEAVSLVTDLDDVSGDDRARSR